ncbi:hypothetical protein [Sorangium sp. So ce1000]|uniref:hypothetical protein n=1 Tax=Sorangium sp. So ce1000 TaxID=3133325 RepID=UPI003F5DD45B
MSRNDDAYPPAPTGYGPPSRRTLPYPDMDDGRRGDAAGRALELATSAVDTVRAVQEDVSEIKELLGKPETPGHPGTGLVGAVMQMQQTLDRLVRAEEARAKASTPPPRRGMSKPLVLALVAALGGGGGIAGLIHAATGNAAPPAVQQQQQQPPRGP